MTKKSTILFLVVALAGCDPLQTYYKPGASVTELNRDQLACEAAALRSAPVAMEVKQDPPIYHPDREICDTAGNCFTREGFYEAGRIFSVDANAPLRARLEGQCMADKGYVLASIPDCPREVAAAVTPAATRSLPPLTQSTCVIRRSDGSLQIVTPP